MCEDKGLPQRALELIRAIENEASYLDIAALAYTIYKQALDTNERAEKQWEDFFEKKYKIKKTTWHKPKTSINIKSTWN